MGDREKNIKYAGHAISAGLVIGHAFVYRERLEALAGPDEIEAHQIEAELERIDRAISSVAEDLRISARRIEADTNAKLAAIFQTHELMLQDPAVREEIRKLVQEEYVSAAHALARVFRRWERKFRELTDPKLQQQASDVADLRQRLLREMAGIKTSPLEKMPPERVLVARQLLPSDTVALSRRELAGIVVEFAGPGSHAALLAEALGIPTVAQIPNLTVNITDEDLLIVDGYGGEVIINPDEACQERYRERLRRSERRNAQLLRSANQPACTRDGTSVSVMANVGCREDVVAAMGFGADGVGLYRMEQYYLTRKTPPDASELLAELRTAFEPMSGKPLTIRLLDLGGDKPLPFMKLPAEGNPFLGRRGVRLLLHYPDLLDAQLNALCQFAREEQVQVLVPMVTLTEEMSQVRSRFKAIATTHGRNKLPPVGAMVETPAAALNVPDLITQAEFLSIGTNDLTQYTMAAGRENPLVSDYFRETHPAMLRLLELIVKEAGRIPVAICGELARQLEVIPKLLQLGIRTLSVPPPLVPAVKDTIRQTVLSGIRICK